MIDLVFERGAFEFHLFDFGIGDWQLPFLEAADLIVDVIVFGHQGVEFGIGGPKGIEHGAPFGEFVADVVVF